MIHLYFQSLWQGHTKDLWRKTIATAQMQRGVGSCHQENGLSGLAGAALKTNLTAQPKKKNANRQVLGKEEEILAPLCKQLPVLRRMLQSQSEDTELKHPRTSQLQRSRDAQKGDSSNVCS